jgi:hypothetical protein
MLQFWKASGKDSKPFQETFRSGCSADLRGVGIKGLAGSPLMSKVIVRHCGSMRF